MTFLLLTAASHAAATLFMTGLIWFVQLVHYPLFDRVGTAGFPAFQAEHMRRTTWVVGPPMLVEAVSAVLLWWSAPDRVPGWIHVAGLGLLVLIWGSTAFLQVPCHARLARGFDAETHRRLVRSNWIRVAGWTARTPMALWLLASLGTTSA